jgi:hypothetical protein
MTVLTAVQGACKNTSVGIFPAPTALFNSTEQQEIELCNLANETAQMIAKAHDWRLFTTLKTQAGDGSDTAFALPADYDRMPVKAKVWLTSNRTPLTRVEDTDEWMAIQLNSFSGLAGFWMILGGELNVYPAVSASTSVKYYYQSNLIVDPASGDNKATFTLDTDTFRLSERLLTLGMIWMWRSKKGLDFQQELANFNLAFAQETGRDKGSRMLMLGKPRTPAGVTVAYPGTIIES